MNDSKMTNHLVQSWVSVTDVHGRTHLEARWIEPRQGGVPAHVTTHAA